MVSFCVPKGKGFTWIYLMGGWGSPARARGCRGVLGAGLERFGQRARAGGRGGPPHAPTPLSPSLQATANLTDSVSCLKYEHKRQKEAKPPKKKKKNDAEKR